MLGGERHLAPQSYSPPTQGRWGLYIILNDYLEIRPEKEARIKKLVKGGKLIIGPWFTQPNEFMVSGEAMIRNLILGYRECGKFGKVMKVCYLPDAFGHISQLPQIMAGFGMQDAVLWRGLPRGYQTVFNWKGADGTECLVFNLISAYGNASDLPVSTEDFTRINDSTEFHFKGLRERINNIVSRLGTRAADPHLLLFNGVDHSFAQADLPEIIKKINTIIPDVKAVQASLPSHIKEVRKYHDDTNTPFQSASGELRDPSEGEILPASQSTMTDVKIQSCTTEFMYEKWMEPFAAYCWLLGHQYPKAEIWKAWTYLLENHAHDSMACSNVDPSYHQIMAKFEWALELGQDIVTEQLQKICNGIPNKDLSVKTLAVFNPLGWARSEVVTATIDIPSAVKKHETRESFVIRVFNLTEKAVSSYLKLNIPQRNIYKAFSVNLNEERIREVPVETGNRIKFKLMKKQIMTFEITFFKDTGDLS